MISRSPGWISARVGEEIMLMSVERSKYIGLTETGARIWDMLDAPRTADYLCGELCREYEISPELCRTQIDAFLLDMAKQGALAVAAY
jgi:hypothetical protein